ncbi:MAG: hypothetical protein KAX49_19780 [Halanaerobiales bacterium]|nr:hypothetical protein [Halanaerobiales bacterium]
MKKKFCLLLVLFLVVLGAVACLNKDVKEVISEKTYEGFTVAEVQLQNKNLKLDDKILSVINEKYPDVIPEDHFYVECDGEKMFWPEEKLLAMLDGTYIAPVQEEINTQAITSPFKALVSETGISVEIRDREELEEIMILTSVTALYPYGASNFTTALLELHYDHDVSAALKQFGLGMVFLAADLTLGNAATAAKLSTQGAKIYNTASNVVTIFEAGISIDSINDSQGYYADAYVNQNLGYLVMDILYTEKNREGKVTAYTDGLGVYKLDYFKSTWWGNITLQGKAITRIGPMSYSYEAVVDTDFIRNKAEGIYNYLKGDVSSGWPYTYHYQQANY